MAGPAEAEELGRDGDLDGWTSRVCVSLPAEAFAFFPSSTDSVLEMERLGGEIFLAGTSCCLVRMKAGTMLGALETVAAGNAMLGEAEREEGVASGASGESEGGCWGGARGR